MSPPTPEVAYAYMINHIGSQAHFKSHSVSKNRSHRAHVDAIQQLLRCHPNRELQTPETQICAILYQIFERSNISPCEVEQVFGKNISASLRLQTNAILHLDLVKEERVHTLHMTRAPWPLRAIRIASWLLERDWLKQYAKGAALEKALAQAPRLEYLLPDDEHYFRNHVANRSLPRNV